MSLLRSVTPISKPSEVPSHVVIKDVPREFVKITFAEAVDYVTRCHQLDPSPPDPLIAEAAIAQSWRILMEDKEYDSLEWERLFPSDRILTFFEELPPALQDVCGEDTSVERVVNHASIRMDVLREDMPPPPPGHPGQITPLFVGEEPDLATMAIAKEVLRASEWQCYLHNVGWENLSDVYNAVMADVKEYTDAERDGQNLLWGQEDPFNYSEKEDWQINHDTHWSSDVDIWERIGEIEEDIWNRAIRATRHVKYSLDAPEYNGHYALKEQKKDVPHPAGSAREALNEWER